MDDIAFPGLPGGGHLANAKFGEVIVECKTQIGTDPHKRNVLHRCEPGNPERGSRDCSSFYPGNSSTEDENYKW